MTTCEFCAEKIPRRTSTCPYCKSELRTRASATGEARWDAATFFLTALLVIVVGGVAAGLIGLAEPDVGIVLGAATAVFASVFVGIGVVAKGVEVGLRTSRRSGL